MARRKRETVFTRVLQILFEFIVYYLNKKTSATKGNMRTENSPFACFQLGICLPVFDMGICGAVVLGNKQI